MRVRQRKQKGSRVSNFTLLMVLFKRQHGSEGVKVLLDSGSVAFSVVDVHCPAGLAEMRLVFIVCPAGVAGAEQE